ncbi:unnamed protein product, partial [Nesidiocoris tenuis]
MDWGCGASKDQQFNCLQLPQRQHNVIAPIRRAERGFVTANLRLYIRGILD